MLGPSGPEHRAATETVREALESANVEPMVLDDATPVGAMWSYEVSKAIESADIIIADVSQDNPNVLYELGYAHALRKPTLLLLSTNRSGSLPFDISSYQLATYDPADPSVLKHQVRTFLEYQSSRLP